MSTELYISQEQQLLDLINQSNLTNISLTEIIFRSPIVVNPLIDPSERNTRIVVDAAASSDYSESQEFYYNRIDLADIVNTTDDRLFVGIARGVVDLLDEINRQYGVHLTATDIVNVALPTLDPGESTLIMLAASSTSLVYTNQIQIRIYGLDASLNTTIKNNIMPGFVYPHALILDDLLTNNIMPGFFYPHEATLGLRLPNNVIPGFFYLPSV